MHLAAICVTGARGESIQWMEQDLRIRDKVHTMATYRKKEGD